MVKKLLLGLSGLLLSATLQAQIVDSTFGTYGFVNTSFSATTDAWVSVVLQPDGKIVTGGVATISGKQHFVLARYDTTGALDATFGTGGKVVMPNNGVDNRLTKIALQPDGKILAVGMEMVGSYSPWNTLIARFTSNGMLDNGFGTGGKNITTVGTKADLYFVLLQPDGKILVCGTEYTNNYFIVIRYNAAGTLDNSFGTAGIAMGNDFGTGTALTLQPDGKILVCGEFWGTTSLGGPHVGVARLNSNGTFDNTFGTNGSTIVLSPYGDELWGGHDIKLQPDGKILIPLFLQSTNIAHEPAIVRLTTTGQVDKSWGGTGYAKTYYCNFYEKGEQMVIQPDGKVLLAGYVQGNGGAKDSILVMRFDNNGWADATFGNNARLTTQTNANGNSGNSIALLADGRFYIAGSTGASGATRKNMLVRYKYATTTTPPNPNSVANVSNDNSFSLYPNPATDMLHIVTPATEADVTITDMAGKTIISGQLNADKTIDVSRLAAGTYTLSLQTTENTKAQIFTVQ